MILREWEETCLGFFGICWEDIVGEGIVEDGQGRFPTKKGSS